MIRSLLMVGGVIKDPSLRPYEPTGRERDEKEGEEGGRKMEKISPWCGRRRLRGGRKRERKMRRGEDEATTRVTNLTLNQLTCAPCLDHACTCTEREAV